MGVVAVLFFVSSSYSLLTAVNRPQTGRLSSSQGVPESSDTLKSVLSAGTWGLILAKMRTGLAAAGSLKDHEAVQSSWKRMLLLLLAVGLLNLAQIDMSSLPRANMGRSLQATDYQQALKDSVDEWRASLSNKPEASPSSSGWPVAPWFSAVALAVFGIVYVYTFSEYKRAVEKHAQLTQVFTNPNAKVATGDVATQILTLSQASQQAPQALPIRAS